MLMLEMVSPRNCESPRARSDTPLGKKPGVTTLGPVVNKLNAAVATPGFFPNGVSLRARGDSQFLGETISSMSIALLTSFALVYVLMVILYGSFFTPAVIMLSVPVALVGA